MIQLKNRLVVQPQPIFAELIGIKFIIGPFISERCLMCDATFVHYYLNIRPYLQEFSKTKL